MDKKQPRSFSWINVFILTVMIMCFILTIPLGLLAFAEGFNLDGVPSPASDLLYQMTFWVFGMGVFALASFMLLKDKKNLLLALNISALLVLVGVGFYVSKGSDEIVENNLSQMFEKSDKMIVSQSKLDKQPPGRFTATYIGEELVRHNFPYYISPEDQFDREEQSLPLEFYYEEEKLFAVVRVFANHEQAYRDLVSLEDGPRKQELTDDPEKSFSPGSGKGELFVESGCLVDDSVNDFSESLQGDQPMSYTFYLYENVVIEYSIPTSSCTLPAKKYALLDNFARSLTK